MKLMHHLMWCHIKTNTWPVKVRSAASSSWNLQFVLLLKYVVLLIRLPHCEDDMSNSMSVLPSGSRTVGWGSGRAYRWPRRCSRYTPDTTPVSMMCCSVITIKDIKHYTGQNRITLSRSIIILTHPHVIFMLTAGPDDSNHITPGLFVHIDVAGFWLSTSLNVQGKCLHCSSLYYMLCGCGEVLLLHSSKCEKPM